MNKFEIIRELLDNEGIVYAIVNPHSTLKIRFFRSKFWDIVPYPDAFYRRSYEETDVLITNRNEDITVLNLCAVSALESITAMVKTELADVAPWDLKLYSYTPVPTLS